MVRLIAVMVFVLALCAGFFGVQSPYSNLLTTLVWVVWWVGFAFSAILLASVFLAEYITIDASAPPYGFARAGLTALAYALFLILATSLRFSGARMFLLVPVTLVVAALISLRILHLDGTDRWDFPWSIGIGLVCAQIGAGLLSWSQRLPQRLPCL
jgi:hypothetical protein